MPQQGNQDLIGKEKVVQCKLLGIVKTVSFGVEGEGSPSLMFRTRLGSVSDFRMVNRVCLKMKLHGRLHHLGATAKGDSIMESLPARYLAVLSSKPSDRKRELSHDS